MKLRTIWPNPVNTDDWILCRFAKFWLAFTWFSSGKSCHLQVIFHWNSQKILELPFIPVSVYLSFIALWPYFFYEIHIHTRTHLHANTCCEHGTMTHVMVSMKNVIEWLICFYFNPDFWWNFTFEMIAGLKLGSKRLTMKWHLRTKRSSNVLNGMQNSEL